MSKTVPVTIELRQNAFKNLTRMAKAEKKTVSEVINDFLSLPSRSREAVKSQQNPLTGIIGIAHTGLGDAAQNHDTYLYKNGTP